MWLLKPIYSQVILELDPSSIIYFPVPCTGRKKKKNICFQSVYLYTGNLLGLFWGIPRDIDSLDSRERILFRVYCSLTNVSKGWSMIHDFFFFFWCVRCLKYSAILPD